MRTVSPSSSLSSAAFLIISAPAAVSENERVVRLSNLTPNSSSKRLICLDITERSMLRISAALAKEPCSTTSSNIKSRLVVSIITP